MPIPVLKTAHRVTHLGIEASIAPREKVLQDMAKIVPSFVMFALGLLFMAFAVGCNNDDLNRYSVSGTVTFAGKPVPRGEIYFDPDSERGNHGPGMQVKIVDGRFETKHGAGIVGGPYVVRIHGTDGIPVEIPHEGVNESGQPLFEEYSLRVEFPYAASTQDFVISANAQGTSPVH